MVVVIVQARMGSTRLPGKVLADVIGRPAIGHLFAQLADTGSVDGRVVATTEEPVDDALAAYAHREGWEVFRGSQNDVLDRYYQAAVRAGCSGRDAIVRITADDILIDPDIIEQLVALYQSRQPAIDYVSNMRTAGFPYGAGAEVFSFDALESAWSEASAGHDREHVTPFLIARPERFGFDEIVPAEDHSHIRLSIDTLDDLEFNRRLLQLLHSQADPPFHLDRLLACVERLSLTTHP